MKTNTKTEASQDRCYTVEYDKEHVEGCLTQDEAQKLVLDLGPKAEMLQLGKGGRVADRMSYNYVNGFCS